MNEHANVVARHILINVAATLMRMSMLILINGNEKTKKYIIQDLLKLRLFGDISENDQRSLRALRSSVI